MGNKICPNETRSHESVTALEGRVTEQGRILEYCAYCEDQLLRDKLISGINNERFMSKLLDKGHRNKATKEVSLFKTMLQIAKDFEQCEKAKAVMQQANGPTEQVIIQEQGYPLNQSKTGVKVILVKANQRKTGGKVSPVAMAKLICVSIVQGLHSLALYPQLQTGDALGKVVGESDIFPGRVEWEHPILPNLWKP